MAVLVPYGSHGGSGESHCTSARLKLGVQAKRASDYDYAVATIGLEQGLVCKRIMRGPDVFAKFRSN
jgi:hypothetical protein